ncbi:Lrp/AsnC family transcriptional regulator [Actinoallomurus iriomotensis]|uniref:HTH asnC-type domain-containing protein n=1 Tax=Actinoallomurus iriomotensis TaxID=478107 RepID=A0A9W6VMK6_9ACTN|nr:Lrp/AsnC family transcriptional regulator [Actinoallomurus iriomotensis]GLY72547.1 hypothetical protein Airi01_008140 [Actinoallomurus iriomotensis]
MSAHSLLRAFTSPTDWVGLHWLSDNQAAALRPDPPVADNGPIELDTGDETLLEALARDGRMGYAELATITGWSDSTVKRRMDHLRRNGILTYMVDIPSATLGLPVEARLWMRVRPAAWITARVRVRCSGATNPASSAWRAPVRPQSTGPATKPP